MLVPTSCLPSEGDLPEEELFDAGFEPPKTSLMTTMATTATATPIGI